MSLRNHVQLVGNIGKDPVRNQTQSGKSVVSFSMATTEGYKDQSGEWKNETTWHNCKIWGKSADSFMEKAKKGTAIMVSGSLKYGKYTDAKGVERYTTDIIVDQYQILSGSQKDNKIQSTNTSPAVSNERSDDDLPF